jgi:hypothetical protein
MSFLRGFVTVSRSRVARVAGLTAACWVACAIVAGGLDVLGTYVLGFRVTAFAALAYIAWLAVAIGAVVLLWMTMPDEVMENATQAVLGSRALLLCATVLTLGSNHTLDLQALRDRGRVVQAVVVHSYASPTNDGIDYTAQFAFLSGKPIPGIVEDQLSVGQRVTVTISPQDAVPPALGGRPGKPDGWWWTMAGFLVLQLAVLAFFAQAWARDQ